MKIYDQAELLLENCRQIRLELRARILITQREVRTPITYHV
jgi:hypothetical protein